jgi:hypothetical protein
MAVKVRLRPSNKSDKKWMVTFVDDKRQKVVHFGAQGMSDYTFHKNPMRMRSYVGRHGGTVPKTLMDDTNSKSVHRRMLGVRSSDREKWDRSGMKTPGFWSRWLTWSMPTTRGAKKLIEERYGIQFV